MWLRVPLVGGAARLPAAHPYRLHDFPDLALHPHDPYLERGRRARLSDPPVPDRALAALAARPQGEPAVAWLHVRLSRRSYDRRGCPCQRRGTAGAARLFDPD